MDYLYETFGQFQPHRDRDAAVKFALSVLLMDGRLDDLTRLVTPGSTTSGVAGEPGWDVDRIDTNDGAGVQFRANVDPSAYVLAHPDGTYDAVAFWRFLRPLLLTYRTHHPDAGTAVDRILRFEPAMPLGREAAVTDLNVAEIPFENGTVRYRYSRYLADDGQRWIRHGLFRAYATDGTLASEGHYEHGLEHGLWRDYHESGQLAAEGHYDQGREVAETWRYWDPTGETRRPK